jgi:hypothetical protein
VPITATAVRGYINTMIEASPGMIQLLPPTAMTTAVAITGFVAPTGSTGMRYLIRITNWTASGSIAIVGTGTPSNTESPAIATPTTQQTQSPQLVSFDYLTVNAYTAMASITPTGVTNGIIQVWGIQAGKYSLPAIMKSKRTPKIYSPNEHNSLVERDKKVVQLVQDTTIDEIKQDAYSDLSLWWCYLMFGAPTTTATIPATPLSMVASAPITGATTTLTITTQPASPGMKLQVVTTAFTTMGTLTVVGVVNGVAGVTEVITVSAIGTVYSSNVYSTVATITNATTAATLSITGVHGFSLTFGSGAAMASAAIEWFDGTGSWSHPFAIMEDGTFDAKVGTEISVTCKGKAQDRIPIGDRTTTPLSGTSRIANLGVNLNDMPMVGWQTKVYLDAITGTPMTTQNFNVEELKVDIKVPQEAHWTFNNSQNYNRAYPVKRQAMVTMLLDFIDMLTYEQFRQQLKQYLAVQFLGQLIGFDTGVPFYKSWTWTLPIRSDGGFDTTSDPTKGNVSASTTWLAEYDPGISGSYRLVIVTQVPPATYTA